MKDLYIYFRYLYLHNKIINLISVLTYCHLIRCEKPEEVWMKSLEWQKMAYVFKKNWLDAHILHHNMKQKWNSSNIY